MREHNNSNLKLNQKLWNVKINFPNLQAYSKKKKLKDD